MREIINLNFNWLYSSNFEDEHLKDYANVTKFQKAIYLIILLRHPSIILMKKKLKK